MSAASSLPDSFGSAAMPGALRGSVDAYRDAWAAWHKAAVQAHFAAHSMRSRSPDEAQNEAGRVLITGVGVSHRFSGGSIELQVMLSNVRNGGPPLRESQGESQDALGNPSGRWQGVGAPQRCRDDE